MIDNILVVILAGGKSTRMGVNKLYIDFNGFNLLDYNIEKFRSFGFKKIIISGSIEHDFAIADIKDIKGYGPLSGIFSILLNKISYFYKYILFLPVDMPFLNKNLIFNMLNNYNYFDIVVYDRYNLPILVYLSKKFRDKLIKVIENNIICNLSISHFLDMFNVLKKKTIFFDKKKFLNLNYKTDLRSLNYF